MHWECLFWEQDSVRNTEERKSGCGLIVFQIGHSFLLKLTKVLERGWEREREKSCKLLCMCYPASGM